jgi:hypothetical protein
MALLSAGRFSLGLIHRGRNAVRQSRMKLRDNQDETLSLGLR